MDTVQIVCHSHARIRVIPKMQTRTVCEDYNKQVGIIVKQGNSIVIKLHVLSI